MCARQLNLVPFIIILCTLQMNLASQSVLEGLNACLDHRGEVSTFCSYNKVSLLEITIFRCAYYSCNGSEC